jgi:acyl carrier protein
MTRSDIKTALADILTEVSGQAFADLPDDGSIRERLHLDSLDLIAMATEIHARLGVALEIADVDEGATVGSLIDVLHARLSQLPPLNRAA